MHATGKWHGRATSPANNAGAGRFRPDPPISYADIPAGGEHDRLSVNTVSQAFIHNLALIFLICWH